LLGAFGLEPTVGGSWGVLTLAGGRLGVGRKSLVSALTFGGGGGGLLRVGRHLELDIVLLESLRGVLDASLVGAVLFLTGLKLGLERGHFVIVVGARRLLVLECCSASVRLRSQEVFEGSLCRLLVDFGHDFGEGGQGKLHAIDGLALLGLRVTSEGSTPDGVGRLLGGEQTKLKAAEGTAELLLGRIEACEGVIHTLVSIGWNLRESIDGCKRDPGVKGKAVEDFEIFLRPGSTGLAVFDGPTPQGRNMGRVRIVSVVGVGVSDDVEQRPKFLNGAMVVCGCGACDAFRICGARDSTRRVFFPPTW